MDGGHRAVRRTWRVREGRRSLSAARSARPCPAGVPIGGGQTSGPKRLLGGCPACWKTSSTLPTRPLLNWKRAGRLRTRPGHVWRSCSGCWRGSAGTRRPRPRSSNSAGNPFSRGNGSCSLTFSPKRRPRIPTPRSRPWPPTRRARSPALDCARRTDAEKQRLLEAVQRLVPADRLLGRDCQRFLVRGFGR